MGFSDTPHHAGKPAYPIPFCRQRSPSDVGLPPASHALQERLPALATSITRIPSVLVRLRERSLHTLCDEILKDVALTQKLLRVVNTAHYRRAGTDPISTVCAP